MVGVVVTTTVSGWLNSRQLEDASLLVASAVREYLGVRAAPDVRAALGARAVLGAEEAPDVRVASGVRKARVVREASLTAESLPLWTSGT
jgi:hypothetical protein